MTIDRISSSVRVYINIGALALVLLVNYLANALPINNLTQGDISQLYPVLLTPAPYAFSIWGLIFLGLIAFVIYQAIPGYRDTSLTRAVSILFAVSCFFNVAWVLVWHYLRVGWSMVIMLLLLATLIAIYLRIGSLSAEKNLFDRLLVKYPFSLYLGWISAATLVNFNVLLYDMGWLSTGVGGVLFTILMVVMAALIALGVFYLRRDYVYTSVFIWALIGIGVRHHNEIFILTIVAWLAAVLVFYFFFSRQLMALYRSILKC